MSCKDVVVAASPGRAFAMWTANVDQWWPADLRRSGAPGSRIALEPGLGGRLVEHAADGREVVHGYVLAWRPSQSLRLALFLGPSDLAPSEVNVTFTPVSEGTQIDVRPTAGALGDERFRALSGRVERNWEDLQDAFAAYAPAPRLAC